MRIPTPPHLLFTCQSDYIGGAELELLYTLRVLRSKKIKISLLLSKKGAVARLFKNEGIKTTIIPSVAWERYREYLSTFLKKNHITGIHTFSLRWLDFQTALVAKTMQLPFIWHIHARLEVIYPRLTMQQKEQAISLIHELSTRVITCSQFLSQPFRNMHMDKKVVTIANGIDTKKFAPLPNKRRMALRKRWHWEETDIVVGMLGRITPQKRLEDFIEAAGVAKARCPSLKFVATGSCASKQYRLSLQRRNRKNGYPVVFTDFCTDIPSLLNALDIAVLTSMHDAFPLSILEAMACGKPVIATASGGIPEIVTPGVTGILVPAGDTKAIADAITHLAKHPLEVKKMGNQARKKAIRHFDISLTVKKLEKLYGRIFCKKQVS